MSIRSINRLKYMGKTYTDFRKIKSIVHEANCGWILDCEMESADLEINKNTIIFNDGIFYNGDFEYGIFRGGEFRGGKFINGIFDGGKFTGGKFISGIKK